MSPYHKKHFLFTVITFLAVITTLSLLSQEKITFSATPKSEGSPLIADKPQTPEIKTAKPQSDKAKNARTPVIFDTDMDTDCDDLGAMAILHAMADQGEIKILATTCSSKYPYSGPCIQTVNDYYGRKDLPVGVPKGKGASIDRGSQYARPLVERFKPAAQTNDDLPDAVTVLRKALAESSDQSVVLVTVGYLTNLSDLLKSEPDTISDLSGRDLVAKKILRYVCMGGRYPEQLSYGN